MQEKIIRNFIFTAKCPKLSNSRFQYKITQFFN